MILSRVHSQLEKKTGNQKCKIWDWYWRQNFNPVGFLFTFGRWLWTISWGRETIQKIVLLAVLYTKIDIKFVYKNWLMIDDLLINEVVIPAGMDI